MSVPHISNADVVTIQNLERQASDRREAERFAHWQDLKMQLFRNEGEGLQRAGLIAAILVLADEIGEASA